MTYSTDPYDDYREQGQQNDYFDADLSRAGNRPNQEGGHDHREQGQQDDYFDADISEAGDREARLQSADRANQDGEE